MMASIANYPLLIGGLTSLIASALHIGIIFGGPNWYRFFGAGEEMAQMAARGDIRAVIITLFIAGVLAIWSAFGFSGAGLIPRLPFMRFCLIGISAVYLIRGLVPFLIMPLFPHISGTFWIISSGICAFIGFCYAIGTYQMWQSLAKS